jgi:hypothetical protein
MPATAAKTTKRRSPVVEKYLTIYEAVSQLEQLTNLRISYRMLHMRIKRARKLPARTTTIGPRNRLAIREVDLSLWAAWIKENT